MKIADILQELQTVAEKKSIRVSYENMGGELGAGGLCKLRGEHRIIVDRRATDGEKVTVLAQALAQFPLEDVFMSEQTRNLIEKSRPQPKATETSPSPPAIE